MGYLFFNIVNFCLNLFISLLMVIFISVWCLFRAPMISFFFLCFLIFFSFDVLEFLEWLLYVLVDHV
jgi:hypothetical protein